MRARLCCIFSRFAQAAQRHAHVHRRPGHDDRPGEQHADRCQRQRLRRGVVGPRGHGVSLFADGRDRGGQGFVGLTVHALDGLVAGRCVEVGRLEGLQALAIALAHAGVRLTELLQQFARRPGGQGLGELVDFRAHRGFALLEAVPVALELLGIATAQQDVLPFLYLRLEVAAYTGHVACGIVHGLHVLGVGGHGRLHHGQAGTAGGDRGNQAAGDHEGELGHQFHLGSLLGNPVQGPAPCRCLASDPGFRRA
jgi:hypothetical protein